MPTNAAATGFWSAQNANNARQGRALTQALFVAASTTSPLTTIRSGVISTVSDGTYGYDLRVTVASGLTMTVQPGSAIIGRSGQGAYLTWNLPAADSVTCDPAPASNPRNDIVVLRAYDAALGDTVPGSGANLAQIEIITGTPGAIPADPVTWDSTGLITSFPTSGGGVGIPLARAQVSTGGVITLTDIRRGTAPVGAVRVLLPGDSLSDPSYMPGDIRWYNGLDFWDGTNWNELGRPRAGGEYQASGSQTASASGPTKITFGSTVQAASGITWNGSNQFTTVTAGIYSMYAAANTGFSSTGNWGVGIHNGTGIPGSTTPWFSAPTFSQGQTDGFTATTMYLPAGQTISAYFYNNENATRVLNATKPCVFRVWRIHG
ncbi:hypothetical protein AB0383_20645 [Amycolatopsis sp. NPDC051373]|uniref:hypothetical protein n=1 Tax=Amycolatopsis sp. NPDC051373 TaxID=3155801 RepID=UPI00344E5BBA